MRIDNENMELMLFDLLEGNLDAETERKVREEIANNPVWEREWKLMQRTVLIPETDIVFEKKHLLLKPLVGEFKAIESTKTRKIIPIYWRWIAVSAAACLIFFIWFGTQDQSKNTLPDVATVKPIKPNLKTVESNQSGKTDPSKSEFQKPESVNNPIAEKAKEHDTPNYEPETITKNPVQEPSVFRKETEPIIGLSVSEPRFHKTAIEKPVPTLIPWQTDSSNIQNNLAMVPKEPKPDKGLKNLMAIGVARWIEPYRNPKIKLAAGRSENKPVLMFTFNNNSYHAAAVVQLKTND